MTAKYLQKIEFFSQRNNRFSPGVACFPTSAAMALHYLGIADPYDGMQLEDNIVKLSLNLTAIEKQELVNENGSWILKHRPFQVIPIMEYVCKKLYKSAFMSWSISFDDIIESINDDCPVVCLGDFSSLSYVGGHYNCIIGYDTDTKTVFTMDPFGNAYKNYTVFNGENINYDWGIFCQEGTQNSYGLIFTK